MVLPEMEEPLLLGHADVYPSTKASTRGVGGGATSNRSIRVFHHQGKLSSVHATALLRCYAAKMATQVAGQCLGPILKVHAAAEEEMDCLTCNDEPDKSTEDHQTEHEAVTF